MLVSIYLTAAMPHSLTHIHYPVKKIELPDTTGN